ncbi:hypothetical protein ACIP39_11675 [Streptomyces tibetensis]|uniref:hypothetical protein n=1 Tax=Streptomyces tibetensis TaxID=2382123 RepID=UPI00380BD310
MTGIEELLSRALLVRERTRPRDTVPASVPRPKPDGAHTGQSSSSGSSHAAAEDLRALCETLVQHTPPHTVAKFVTDQVPEPAPPWSSPASCS